MIDRINKSIESGSIYKNRMLDTIIFVKSIPVRPKINHEMSKTPLHSRGKIFVLSKDDEFEELSKEMENANEGHDPYQDKKEGDLNGKKP